MDGWIERMDESTIGKLTGLASIKRFSPPHFGVPLTVIGRFPQDWRKCESNQHIPQGTQ